MCLRESGGAEGNASRVTPGGYLYHFWRAFCEVAGWRIGGAVKGGAVNVPYLSVFGRRAGSYWVALSRTGPRRAVLSREEPRRE